MKKINKEKIIKEINESISNYNLLYKTFEKIDDEVFNKFYRKFPYGEYNPLKRLISKGELKKLKIKRKEIFEKLKSERDNIVYYEKENGVLAGETPHCSFTKVVNGGYGANLSRSYGDLAKLNENGYFPMICHQINTLNNKRRKLFDFEEEIMSNHNSECIKYGINGYDITLNEIDNY